MKYNAVESRQKGESLGGSKPLVSVKMLTYNHAAYISQAMEGVLTQRTDFPFELVVGEDCSTDGTREIVFEYQRRFPNIIRIVTTTKNVGMHANSDRTHEACRGEYIAFCEGDDYWQDQSKLQMQVDHLTAHSEYVLVHSNCDLFYVQTEKRVRDYLPCRPDSNDAAAYEEILTRKRNVQTLTVVTRKAAIDRVLQENPECTNKQFLMRDIQLWLELARHGKIKYFQKSLATHNMLQESATHSRDPQKELRFALSVRDLIYHYVRKYECTKEGAREAKASATLFALSRASRSGDAVLSLELYQEHCRLRNRPSPHALLLVIGSRSKLARSMTEPLSAAYLLARRFVNPG